MAYPVNIQINVRTEIVLDIIGIMPFFIPVQILASGKAVYYFY